MDTQQTSPFDGGTRAQPHTLSTPMGCPMRSPALLLLSLALGVGPTLALAFLAMPVTTDLQLPGTQPQQATLPGNPSQCDNCHGGYDPAVEPAYNWCGSMMSQAGRDPVFWATVAVAEQDFPEVGDLCIRCHSPRGWLEGRSTPTDGSGLTSGDLDGTECALCHALANPDGNEHAGFQTAPYIANDRGTPAEGYYGSGMSVVWQGAGVVGPYANTVARHNFTQSRFHRSEDFCGTCHDVSNPVVGDLAHNNGAQVPLSPGTFSGVPGGPLTSKAAFNNFPFQYGMVERTYSESKASALDTLRVRDYVTLPNELQAGSIANAYANAQLAGRGGDYEDGTPRTFTCQSCHMAPTVGHGADKNNVPLRSDLPAHDLTGGNTWTPDAIRHQDGRSELLFGGGLSQLQRDAMTDGQARARANLQAAASLEVRGDTLRIVNLTGHKLITGFPEGRRMWVRVTWRDPLGNVVRVDGRYGALTVSHRGQSMTVETLLEPSSVHTHVFQAKLGMTDTWAAQLMSLGYPANFPLAYDHRNGSTTVTLGDIANGTHGPAAETFHFALNNVFLSDDRIPAWGTTYDEARRRNVLPVPETLYGDPGPGGTYQHWAHVDLDPPIGAATAAIELLYQTTSWEYVQFLDLANDGSVVHLGQEGRKLLDTWLATGMSAPEVMATATWTGMPGTGEDLVLETLVNGAGDPTAYVKEAHVGDLLAIAFRSPNGTFTGTPTGLFLEPYAIGFPPTPLPGFPGVWLSNPASAILVLPLPGAGFTLPVTIPDGVQGAVGRLQAIALSPLASTGLYAASDAHDVRFP